MRHRVEFLPPARGDFLSLPKSVRCRIAARLDELAGEPRAAGTAPLVGMLKGLWRARVGVYRVAYAVDDEGGVVTVWGIGHRSTFYDRIRRRVG